MDFSNEVLVHKNVNGTEFLQFKKLLEFSNLEHCYTLRSNDINIQVKNNDTTEIMSSYKKVAEALNFDDSKIVKPHQTHTDRVEVVNSSNDKFDEVDGVITNKQNIMLCTTSADCTALLFYDDRKKVIGDVHSGWRGTLQKIGKKAVEKMKIEYGCNPEDIICCICPHIRKCHFEVDEDVKELFEKEFVYTGRINEIIEVGKIINSKQKYNIDTTLINTLILKEAGIKENNIVDSGLCTVCNSSSFHSHRVDKELSGRNGAFIGMRGTI